MAPATYAFERRGALPVLTFPLLGGFPVDVVVTTRAGGVSRGPYAELNLGLHVGDDPAAVIANRARGAAALGLCLDEMIFANQVHGSVVAEVGRSDRGRGARGMGDALDGVDALVTRDPGVGLAVLVADCAPIALYDPVGHALAAVHSGWRGAVGKVAAAAVDALAAGGVRREDILAVIGPAVPEDRYQVGADVAAAAAAAFGPDTARVLRPDGSDRWRFDVWAANEQVLTGAGLVRGHVAIARVGTGGGTELFSDRAERPCGRFGLLGVLR